MNTKVKAKRTYKSSVFELLYRDKSNLLELYNGLNGTDYRTSEDLEIYTLENAIYMGMKNDVSFILASELNLYEHQSTMNPNMPLRDLFYIAMQLEKYAKDESIYSSSLIKIPVPRFVVFYNGTDEQPEKMILQLSDAFEKRVNEPELELKVTMLNINLGHNRELMEKCSSLYQYSLLINMIRTYADQMPIDDAVDCAVTECIQKDILRDFLSSQRSEVIAMSILEWNEEIEMEKLRRSERKAARAAFLKEGKAEGLAEGRAEGLAEGRAEGLAEGRAEGLAEGRAEGEALFAMLATRLLEDSRIEEIKKAASDRAFRAELYRQYALIPFEQE